ncbi:MAG: hypothetical protein WBF53_04860 [Litorimonas sp.]
MTDDTKNCDDVAEYLEGQYPDLHGSVLTIHTNKTGQISDAKSKQDELQHLRAQANLIDSWESPYKAVVSVLMLKEGWDVRNVTTIVGLRAHSSSSNILPEQTLGRGLRKMYPGGGREEVSVIGTEAFMDFVKGISAEGVVLEPTSMGPGGGTFRTRIVSIDHDNPSKDIAAMDIRIPVLGPRLYREYGALEGFSISEDDFDPVPYKNFPEAEKREFRFMSVTTGEENHVTERSNVFIGDHRSIVRFFADSLKKELKLVSGFDALYPALRDFMKHSLFGQTVDMEDANTHRNLSEPKVMETIRNTFKSVVNRRTVMDKGGPRSTTTCTSAKHGLSQRAILKISIS